MQLNWQEDAQEASFFFFFHKHHVSPGKLRELKFETIPPLSEPALPLHRQQ